MQVKNLLPEFIKQPLRPAYRRYRLQAELWLGRVPAGTDLVGYETLLDFVGKRGAFEVGGDFVEIGALLGGGTVKLARAAQALGKKVWVVDIFDPGFDLTQNTSGEQMSEVYAAVLRGMSQEEIFRGVTRSVRPWINVIKQDSRTVEFSPDIRFAFGFIDGNHDPGYVRSDFKLIWEHLSPGGWLAFHDYGGDLPQTTGAIDALVKEYERDIQQVIRVGEKILIFLQKNG